MWEGTPCAILASGPSMSQGLADVIKPTLWRTIVTNNTYRLAPWADLLYASDARWWDINKGVKEFQGYRVSIQSKGSDVPTDRNVLLLRGTGVDGYDPEPGCVRTGNNSGYQALHLAVQLGCDPIMLFGFDMRSIKNKQHWHDKYEHPLRDHGDGIYPKWVESFGKLATILNKLPVRIYNVTPGSALKCFPAMTLEEALASFLHDKVSVRVSA